MPMIDMRTSVVIHTPFTEVHIQILIASPSLIDQTLIADMMVIKEEGLTIIIPTLIMGNLAGVTIIRITDQAEIGIMIVHTIIKKATGQDDTRLVLSNYLALQQIVQFAA